MKTSERKLREEILQLPEAQEYFPHHQRRVMDPSDRPRSKSGRNSDIFLKIGKIDTVTNDIVYPNRIDRNPARKCALVLTVLKFSHG
jgi:hypothetical protein